MNANQFPALNGETVTEAHAAICAERGHATHTVNGEDTGTCPRCGQVKGEQFAKFIIVPKAMVRLGGIAYEVREMNPINGHYVGVRCEYPTEAQAQEFIASLS